MDNSKAAIYLFNFMENQYPIKHLSKRSLRIQSARRWAIVELANQLLDHPRENPICIAENLAGQIIAMIYRKTDSNISKDKIRPFSEALGALLHAENYIEEVCK